MNWLKEALLGEYTDSSLLQRSGVIEKERLMTYFEQAMALMNDADFRTDLRKAYEARRDPQDIIDEAQRQIWQRLGVLGAYGIQFLGQVRRVYGKDPEVMQALLTTAQREELLLDELELSPVEYERKLALGARMQAELEKHKEAMQSMPKEQQSALVQRIYAEVMASESACEKGCCAAPVNADPNAGKTSSSMSEAEQMAFFQNLRQQR